MQMLHVQRHQISPVSSVNEWAILHTPIPQLSGCGSNVLLEDVYIQVTIFHARSLCRSLIYHLALINLAGGLYGRILTEIVSTDRTQ